MPYRTIGELPMGVRHVLPKHAQDIYREAFNSAFEEYKKPEARRGDADREAVAHKVAWSAVKRTYEKHPDGKWHPKEVQQGASL